MTNVSEQPILQRMCRSTQTEACSLDVLLFDQLIHNALLELSISEPSAAATLALLGHFNTQL